MKQNTYYTEFKNYIKKYLDKLFTEYVKLT